MTSIATYRAALAALPAADWEPYLLAHSSLPGPRGNLELAQAVADEGTEAQFRRWAAFGSDVAPENTPECFLAFCGVVGLGAVMARRGGFPVNDATIAVNGELPVDGDRDIARKNPPLRVLRALASDPRWRIREAVALQRWGDADMPGLLVEMADWAGGNPWEQRAAAAGLCEPRLLKNPAHAVAVLRILDEITASILQITDRKNDAFKTSRQGLAYCWSVAVAAETLPGAITVETLHVSSLIMSYLYKSHKVVPVISW